MRKILVFKSAWQIIEAIAFITLGIITMIFSNNIDYWKIIGYVSGGLLALDGLFRLIIYFVKDNIETARTSLIICIIEVTLSVFVFIRAEVVVRYFSLLVAILLVVLGFVALVDSITKTIKKSERPIFIILGYCVCLILSALGIVALCFYPYNEATESTNTISVMLVVTGVVLVLGGLFESIYTIVMMIKTKREDKKENEEIAKHREELRNKK